MPSHKIHMYVAKKVNEKLKLDLDSIMLGSVLPDLTIDKDHAKSHYQYEGTYESELANPDKFICGYKSKLNDPIIMGYLIHLLTDRFYNNYFFRNHCIFNDDGMPYKVRLKNEKLHENLKKYKQGDFGKYDKYLLKKHLIPKFNDIKCVNNIQNLKVGDFDREFLIEYIKNTNKEIYNSKLYVAKSNLFYRVMDKKELDSMLNSCIDYILDYIRKNNIL